jgi:predicted nucleic acid-binding protein
MKVLVDTNVILDVLLKRIPFYTEFFTIFKLANRGNIDGWISSASITDIFYLVKKSKQIDTAGIYSLLDDLAALFSIAPVSESTITGALALRWKDFEDAVQFMTAQETGIAYIITRNKADYEALTIPCVSPGEFSTIINSHS